MSVLTPDLCILGAGSGGLVVAAGAAQMGANVVLLEPAKMGGDCLNYGCVPSKALLHAARLSPTPSYAEAMAHVRATVATIEPHDSETRFRGLGVTVIREAGRFVDRQTVETTSGTRIRARRFVVATGSQPAIPPVSGLDNTPYLTNETLWEQPDLPVHLVIMGGGPIGCEMAEAHIRLGAQVTLVEAASLLGKDEPDLVQGVRDSLANKGVVIREGIAATEVASHDGGVAVTLANGEVIAGSHLLVATGRRPVTDGLNLDAAEILLDGPAIRTDARLLTTNPKVYAVGDVSGGPQFTHAASYQASTVIKRALFHLPAKVDHGLVPWVTYTDPELAHIGQTEAAALAAHGDKVQALTWSLRDNDRAIATDRTEGMVKAVVTKHGRILGCSILAPGAGELILPWCLAIQNRLKIGAMAQVIAPYPTLSEASKRVAGSFYSPSLFSERTRSLVRWIQKLP